MNIEQCLCKFLEEFSVSHESPRCLLVTGPSGSGKTTTVRKLICKLGYSEIYLSSLETNLLESIRDIANNLVSRHSVCDLFKSNKLREQVVLIDNIDGMRLNDPASFSALTRLIRKKRTKKQKKEEEFNRVPIICIGNAVRDKKTRELAKSCVQVDYGESKPVKIENNTYVDLIRMLFERELSPIELHSLSTQCDTTVLSMIWHENIVQGFKNLTPHKRLTKYLEVLETLAFCDNVDKVAFSKQTWELAQASGTLKLLGTSKCLHSGPVPERGDKETRFTKILTKYSTAHNIRSFVIEMCNILNVDGAELCSLVREAKAKGGGCNGILAQIDENALARLEKYIT